MSEKELTNLPDEASASKYSTLPVAFFCLKEGSHVVAALSGGAVALTVYADMERDLLATEREPQTQSSLNPSDGGF